MEHKSKYLVQDTVRFNKERYRPGSTIELTERDAQELLASKAITPATGEAMSARAVVVTSPDAGELAKLKAQLDEMLRAMAEKDDLLASQDGMLILANAAATEAQEHVNKLLDKVHVLEAELAELKAKAPPAEQTDTAAADAVAGKGAAIKAGSK